MMPFTTSDSCKSIGWIKAIIAIDINRGATLIAWNAATHKSNDTSLSASEAFCQQLESSPYPEDHNFDLPKDPGVYLFDGEMVFVDDTDYSASFYMDCFYKYVGEWQSIADADGILLRES